jgi:hypothetical protein
MIDFNSTREGIPPELLPILRLLAAVVAQAVKDAGCTIPKKTSKDAGGGHVDESDVRSAIFFLFYPGRLEPFADFLGFHADSFRTHLVCGSIPAWAEKGVTPEQQDRIRNRLIKYGFLDEVQRLDSLWWLRHGR